MLDLIVSGGTAVMPTGAAAADIGVSGEKIVTIGASGTLGEAARVIDATGQIVIPGGVDPHIHCLSPIPFPGRNEDMLSAPPDQVSRAALYGGTTTMLDFVDCPPEMGLQQSIEARRRQWANACYCDYGLHLLVRGKPPLGLLGALPEAIQAGYASVKMFTTNIRPNREGRMVQFGDIWEVLKVVAKEGGIAAIHAEDNDLVMHMYEKLIREDRTGFENMAEVHTTLSEDFFVPLGACGPVRRWHGGLAGSPPPCALRARNLSAGNVRPRLLSPLKAECLDIARCRGWIGSCAVVKEGIAGDKICTTSGAAVGPEKGYCNCTRDDDFHQASQ